MKDDVIYRQDAIEAIHREARLAGGSVVIQYADMFQETLLELPSAQPERTTMRGWICPVCGRGLSPFTSACPCNNGKGWKITC